MLNIGIYDCLEVPGFDGAKNELTLIYLFSCSLPFALLSVEPFLATIVPRVQLLTAN